MAKGKETELSESLLARVAAGVRYIVGGKTPDAWFGPSEPIAPVAQEVVGRQLDYPVAVNLRLQPRESEGISFADLRALAENYDLLRLVIETRKDQLERFKWTIKPKDTGKKPGKTCDEVIDFLSYPDKQHTWSTWLRALLEDLLVVDAPTLYPRLNRAGRLHSLELMDGATIKRVIDQTGRTPAAPAVAYQQILKGLPAVDYNAAELIYMPRNVRTHKLYGYSPVEQIVMSVNIALRRQLNQLQYYTEGNIPEAIAGVPETWSVSQISEFQRYWDQLHEGNTAQRRHMKFVPGDVAMTMTKEPALKSEFDEWLARVVCFAFSIPPTPFVKEVTRANAESNTMEAKKEGLSPQMTWVKNLIDFIITRYFGYTDLEFKWQIDEEIEPAVQAAIDKIYLDAGVVSVDEIRQRQGRAPIGMKNAIYTPTSTTLVSALLTREDGTTATPSFSKPANVVKLPLKGDK